MTDTGSVRLVLLDSEDHIFNEVDERLATGNPAARVLRIESYQEARSVVDAVGEPIVFLSATGYRDGSIDDLLDFTRHQVPRLPVVIYSPVVHPDEVARLLRAGADEWVTMSSNAQVDADHLNVAIEKALARYVREADSWSERILAEHLKILGAAQAVASRIKHEISNPLSIVSGNAQLLIELARMYGWDEDLVQPVRDIEEASRRMNESLEKLSTLKEYLLKRIAEASGKSNGIL